MEGQWANFTPRTELDEVQNSLYVAEGFFFEPSQRKREWFIDLVEKADELLMGPSHSEGFSTPRFAEHNKIRIEIHQNAQNMAQAMRKAETWDGDLEKLKRDEFDQYCNKAITLIRKIKT